MLTKNPHALSAPYVLDPGYSVDLRVPSGAGSSLYSEDAGSGQPWLYVPGDLEAHLMAEARARAFRIAYGLGHHGFFPPPNRSVYFKAALEVDAPFPSGLVFEFAGALRMVINDRFAGWWPPADKPREVRMDLERFLTRGENQFLIMLFGAAEPTCLRPDPRIQGWLCGCDFQRWEEPQELPFVGREAFPHQEKLPTFTIAARTLEDGVYDFGVEVIGRLRLERIDPDATYVFRPGESVPETSYPERQWDEQGDITLDARRNAVADADERAIRYVRLESGPALPPPEALHCDVVVHPAAYGGAFACADPVATRIWMHAAYTLRMCMRDVTIDGLKRDRLPWVGDLYLSLLGNAFTFTEHRLFLRTLLSFYHPHPGEVNFSGILDFTLFWVAAAGDYVLYSGDLRGARLLWPRAQIVLEAMRQRLSPAGFLKSDEAKWVFIDWAELPKKGVLLIIQALYVQALEGGVLLARSLGETEEAERLEAQAARLRRLADERFWDPDQGCYADAWADGALTPNGSRHANAFATLSGIATTARAAMALQAARSNPAAPAGGTPYMRYFENAAYCKAGLPEVMLEEVRRYWGGMLEEGATTLWEAFDASQTGDARYAFYGRPFGKSLCHAWASGPLSLYSSELFGLKPIEPGWRSFTFSPLKVALPWASVCVPTPLGVIRAEMEAETARIEIPAGSAIVHAARRFVAEGRSELFSFRREGGGWVPV